MARTSRPINPEVRIIDGEVVTNTHNLAWVFQLPHDQLLQEINQLACSAEFQTQNFAEVSYTDPEGTLQTMYRVKRDGFLLLTHGLTGHKAEQSMQKYLEAFDRLEETLKTMGSEYKNPFLQWSTLDLMKLQASIEAERKILKRVGGL